MQPSPWWQEIEKTLSEHSLLKHPFYQAWQAGRLSLEDLKYYAAQYYPHVAHFPRYVSAVHSNTPELGVRQMLLENLIEEEQGPDNHPELWLRFAEGLGLTRDEVLKAPIQPETQECVQTFLALARDPDPRVGLSALYAYESQIPAVSRTKREGLTRFYGIQDERAHAFFEVHERADVWHSEVERAALQELARTGEDRERVRQSAQAACVAVLKLLDGVVRARQICAVC